MSGNTSSAPPLELELAGELPTRLSDDALAPPAPSPPTVTIGRTPPITAAEKTRLGSFFFAAQWPLNRKLDTGQKFLGSDVGRIASQLGLNRSQVSRQLLNYKNEKYGNTRISVFLRADELEEKMWLGLSMTAMEFVTSTLERICGNDPSSCSDFINFSTAQQFPSHCC